MHFLDELSVETKATIVQCKQEVDERPVSIPNASHVEAQDPHESMKPSNGF